MFQQKFSFKGLLSMTSISTSRFNKHIGRVIRNSSSPTCEVDIYNRRTNDAEPLCNLFGETDIGLCRS